MHNYLTRIGGAAVLSGFTLASILAVAPAAARADEQDPGVARISLLRGGVDVKRADSGDNVAAVVNAPLNAGDYLSTPDDARAELQLDDLTELRVGSDTQLRFTNIDATSNALQLAQGTVELRLFHGTGANPEVDTPNAAVHPRDNGAYRVSVDNNGNSIVTVRSGSAAVATQNATQTVTAGNSVEIDGDARSAQVQPIDALADDGFDQFNSERDRYEADAHSYAYVNDQFVGADDLDQYGSWQNVDGYGEVWHPHYAADWAPYHDGNWAWEPNYGWTWVSAEPWGWAPYHYGRWFYAANDGGWCWTPATAYLTTVYEPAQVAFFSFGVGFGGGGGISIGFGNVGWLPLGPRDPFRPWWGGGYGRGGYDRGGYGRGGYGGNTTIVNNTTNITNVTNIYNYRNVNAPGSLVAVRSEDFHNGEFRQRVAITPAQLRAANISAVRSVVPVVPSTRNLAYSNTAPARSPRALSPTFDRFKAVSPAAAPRPFTQERAAVTAVAEKAYPSEATAFEREAHASTPAATRTGSVNEPRAQSVNESRAEPVNEARTGATTEKRAPIERNAEPAVTREATTQESRPAVPEAKPASPWDRFDKPAAGSTARLDSARPETRGGAQTETERARPAEAAPAAGNARPSYARPDTEAPRRAVDTPQKTTTGHSTGSPWDRFGSSVPVTRGTTDAPRASGSTTRRAAEPSVSTYDGSHWSTRSTPSTYGSSASGERTHPSESTPQYGRSSASEGTYHRAATTERSRPAERASQEAPAAHRAAERTSSREPAARAPAASHAPGARENSDSHANRDDARGHSRH